MGDLIRAPYSEVTATLELLERVGVTPHDLERLRKTSSWKQSIIGRILRDDPFLWALLDMEQNACGAGFLANDFRALAVNQENLRQVLAFLRIGSACSREQHIIDCDARPFEPSGLMAAPESEQLSGRVRGQFVVSSGAIKLHLSTNQQDGKYIVGRELRKELANEPVLPANVLDWLLANPHLIPEEWKGEVVFFWGTIYRVANGSLCVRCLYFHVGAWHSGYDWLDDVWSGYDPAALRAS